MAAVDSVETMHETPATPASVKSVSRRHKRKKIKVRKTARTQTSLPPVPIPPRSVTPGNDLPNPQSFRIRLLHKPRSPSVLKTQPTSEPASDTKVDRILRKVSQEQSLLISLKNYKLPTRFPERFATFGYYKNDKGDSIPLLHRDQVSRILQSLDKDVQPLVHHFHVHYSALSEGHPQWTKAALTNRIRLQFDKGLKAFAHHIQLRVRCRAAPNDLEKFYNRGTLLGVLFHELAHIRHMNHGDDFMLFLRDIYKFASKTGLFRLGQEHQLPSCRAWENALFTSGGRLSDEELRSISAHTAS